eukprot:10589668-Prorocentrum_lima.AAC.1
MRLLAVPFASCRAEKEPFGFTVRPSMSTLVAYNHFRQRSNAAGSLGSHAGAGHPAETSFAPTA